MGGQKRVFCDRGHIERLMRDRGLDGRARAGVAPTVGNTKPARDARAGSD